MVEFSDAGSVFASTHPTELGHRRVIVNGRAFMLGVVALLSACSAETRLLDKAQAASESEQLDCDVNYAKYVRRKFDEAGCDRAREGLDFARLELEKAGISENRIEAAVSLGSGRARARLSDARRTLATPELRRRSMPILVI
jgi:hypothetical protein